MEVKSKLLSNKKFNNHWILLSLVLIVALIVRLSYFFTVYKKIWFVNPIIDAFNFHNWAINISQGEILGKEIFTQSPLYAYWLGFIYTIFGSKPEIAIFFQLCLGSINCVLIYYLGKKIFSPIIGLLAGLLAAIYGIGFFHEGTLLTVTIINFINLLLLISLYYAFDKEKWQIWIIPGVLIGLSALTRPNILLFIIIIGLGMWFKFNRKKARKTILLWFCTLFLSSFILILPITVRNLIVLKEPILTVGTGGLNFYLGNSIQSVGFHKPLGNLGLSAKNIVNEFKQRAEQDLGRKITYNAASKYWFKKTLQEIRHDPIHWRKIFFDKLLLFFNYYEITTSINYYVIKEFTPFLRLPWLSFRVLGVLGLLGLLLAIKIWKKLYLIYGYFLVYLISNVLLMVSSEYRQAVVPIFCLLGAWGLVELLNKIKLRQWFNLGLSIMLLIMFSFLVNSEIITEEMHRYRKATAHSNFAGLLGRLGEHQRASEEYAIARQYIPDNDRLVLYQGSALIKSRRYQEALQVLEQAYHMAPEEPDILDNYAIALTANGFYDAAIKMRLKALDLAPNNALFYYNLGITYLWARQDEKAQQAFDKCLKIEPSKLAEIEAKKIDILNKRTRP